MKIALITNYWKYSQVGGVRSFLINLVEELTRKNVTVKILYRDQLSDTGVVIPEKKGIFIFKSIIGLKWIEPDIIHSQGTWYCLLPGVIYKKIFGCKLVHTFHSFPEEKLWPPFMWFFQTLINQCDCITFVSKGLYRAFEERFELVTGNVAITYGGVKERQVTDGEIHQFIKQFDLKDRFPIILVQSFTAYKGKAEGLKIVIQSIKKLKDKYPHLILVATKDGIFSKELKSYVNTEGLQDYVLFTGDIDNPYVPLSICDIYAHISLSDGLPLALLEAMSVGKPIVATPVGGIPEVIDNGRNGLLVEPDADVVAEAIEKLLKDEKLRTRLGHNAYADSKKYTWEKCANTFLEVFERRY